LEEISEADLILHVIDCTHPNARQQNVTVMETLTDLGADDRPMLVALNKIDQFPDPAGAANCLADLPNSLPISATQRIGLQALLGRVEEVLSEGLVYVTVLMPYDRGDLITLFHDQGMVVKTSHNGQGTVLEGYLPRRWLEQFRSYLI
jgi:GTP-binding protein HflX